MKWTKERKIYGAVLGLAVVAFGADRFVFSSDEPDPRLAANSAQRINHAPAPAARPALPMAAALTLAAPAGASQEKDPALAGLSALAARMQRVAVAEKLDWKDARDAFCPSAAWVATAKPPDQPAPALSDLADAFRQHHQLVAVIKSSRGGTATIRADKPTGDKATITIARGRKIDGFTLVSVGERSAVLESGAVRVELALPAEDLAAGGISSASSGDNQGR